MLCEDGRYSTVAEFPLQSVYFCEERCGEVSWVLVGALVREVDERLQVFAMGLLRVRGGLTANSAWHRACAHRFIRHISICGIRTGMGCE